MRLKATIRKGEGIEDFVDCVIVDISLSTITLDCTKGCLPGSEVVLGYDTTNVIRCETLTSQKDTDSNLYHTKLKIRPRLAMERIEFIEFVHKCFKDHAPSVIIREKQ